MDQYIGKMLDNRYEILELIGSGGMANVYKAKCHRLNRLVAVKILKSDLADSADFRRRFRDESQAIAQLSHANIVSVYDVSRSDDAEYIVMELIEGITLKQYMERRGQMDWRESLHFITQIMRGLSHAHSRGIIHRDIKPQNIMVLRDGSVKVADFGIACLANAGQTLTQEALGSVHYISPEQARGERTDARSDIYSAGVVLYEMLTGRLPFEGDSAVSVAIQHLSAVPLAPRDINENVPQALELICMKAMNPNADKRYGTADEMLEDLEKFRRDPSVDLEYIRADLQEEVNNEPTMKIPTGKVAAAARNLHNSQPIHVAEEEVPEPTEEELKKQKQKKIAIIAGAVAAALVLVLVCVKIFGGFGAEDPAGHEVPGLLGLTVEEAERHPDVRNVFEIEVIGSKPSEQYEPGQIIEQDPEEGRIRKNNLVINVYVAAQEEEKFYMPNLVGENYQSAKVTLRNLGLELEVPEIREVFSDDVPEGQVMETEPAADTELREGNAILLVVSKGPEQKPVTVISFLHMNVDEATTNARKLGLSVGEHQYEYSDKPAGEVIKQSIEANSTVKEGTAIVFTVSKGGEPRSTEVTFQIPDTYSGEVTVEFTQDGESRGNVTVTLEEGAGGSVSYTFSGAAGSSSQVAATIDGTEIGAQEITF